jgi:hypothetical protein
LTKRVSATTITEITASPGFAPLGNDSSPPAVSVLQDKIRKDLDDYIAFRKGQLDAEPLHNIDPKVQQNYDKAVARRETFEEIIKDVPAGFQLVPVQYAKISQDENAAIHSEYLNNVRSRFLQFVGENHADDLKALGICDAGIERMRKGLDPADETGRPYEVNIDHIIERSGSGLWANSKETDPDQKAEVEPKFRQNHFGNLILLPEEIHEYKNTLNNIQRIGDLQPGQSKWILMMVPERNDLQAGFVCPPQQKGTRWDVLRQRPNDPFRKVSHAAFTVDQANARYNEFTDNPLVEKALKAVAEVAQRQKKTVAEAAADNRPGKRSLSKIFNDILDHDLKARHHADMNLKPALEETTKVVSGLFNEVADYEDRRKKMALVRNFAEFYQSKAMQKLRARADELPFDETLDLQLTFKRIDVELAQLKEALGVKMQQPQGTQKAAKAFNDSAKIVPFPVKGKRPADERHKTQEGQNDNARRRKNKKGKKNKNNAQNQQRFGRRAHG